MTDTLQTDLFQTQTPENFDVELKEVLPHDQGNLCQFCDARKLCLDPEWCKKYPCMSYNRVDGKSVVYKITNKR